MTENADALSRTSVQNLSISTLYDARTRCSFSWKYFGNLVLHDKRSKGRIISADYVYCSACLCAAKAEASSGSNVTFGTAKIRRYNKTVATGNMIRHLRTRHNLVDDYEPINKKKKVREVPKPRWDTWVVAKDLVIWYCKSLMPFDAVSDEAMTGFCQKYKMIGEEVDLPTNSTVAQSALDYVYERMLNEVAEQIFHDAAPNMSFSFDSWADHFRKLNYVTLTLCYLNSEFKLKKFNLSTRIVDNYQPEKMVGILGQIVKQFGLSDRKIYAVTNNQNMTTAALMAGFKQHLCVSYGLHNLIIVDGIKAVPEANIIVSKCRIIIEKVNYRMTELADEGVLQRHLINSFDTVMETLHSDENDPFPTELSDTKHIHGMPTRWHCVLEILEAFISVFTNEQINGLLKHISLEELMITQEEWQLMEEFVKFLSKFREVTEIITAQDACSVHLVLVFRTEIIEVLNSNVDEASIVMLRIKRSMLSNIDSRFPITSFLIATALLDYRFMGLKQIDFYIESKFMTRASFLAAYIKENNIDVTQPNELSLLHKLSIKHGILGDDPQAVQDDMIQKECINYITALDANEPADGNILSYWRERKNMYPRLAVLARALLCVPATNVPSQRAFALTGVDMSTKRSRLHPSGLNKIMFIHDNSDVTTCS